MDGEEKVPKAERQMVARVRDAMHRLVGPEFGDELADQVWKERKARYAAHPPSSDGGGE